MALLRHRKIGIWDTTNNKVLVFSSINEGVDGAAAFSVTNEAEELTIEDGQVTLNNVTPTLDGRFLQGSATDLTDLETLTEGYLDCHLMLLDVVGVTQFSDFSVSDSKVKVSANEAYSSNNVFAIRCAKIATASYFDSSGIKSNYFNVHDNILATRKWADTDGSNVADLWTFTGATVSFTSGVQTLACDTGGDTFSRSVFFPFAGEDLTFSIDIDALGADFSSGSIEIEALDKDDGTVGTATQAFSSTGRVSVTLSDTDSDIAYVTLKVIATAATTTTNIQVSDPMLSHNGTTTFSE